MLNATIADAYNPMLIHVATLDDEIDSAVESGWGEIRLITSAAFAAHNERLPNFPKFSQKLEVGSHTSRVLTLPHTPTIPVLEVVAHA